MHREATRSQVPDMRTATRRDKLSTAPRFILGRWERVSNVGANYAAPDGHSKQCRIIATGLPVEAPIRMAWWQGDAGVQVTGVINFS
jgi:hypothetical protein